MPLFPSPLFRQLLPSLLLVTAVAQTGCDVQDDTTPRTAVAANLSQFGIDGVEVEPGRDDAYALLDSDANDIGRIDIDVADDLSTVNIELQGTRSQMRWTAADSEVELSCEGRLATDTLPTDACMNAMLAASLVAEAEGMDVPNYEAPEQLLQPEEFRATCETISTFAWNCQSCYSAAADASQYPHHSGGSCNQGGVYATCEHKFCAESGGVVGPELPTNF